MKRTPLLASLIASTLTASVAFGQAWNPANEIFVPATDIFNPDGTLTPQAAVPASETLKRQVEVATMWQQKSWERAGRASDLGFAEGWLRGPVREARRHCVPWQMQAEYVRPAPWSRPPHRFDEWVAKSEAILEGRVIERTPGFDGGGDPTMQIKLHVERHLFARSTFPNEVRFLVPVGEFVAGDAIFCRLPTWGYNRPQLGQRMVIGVFFPVQESSDSMLGQLFPTSIIVVDQSRRSMFVSEMRRARGFPTSLDEFVDRVHEKWVEGEVHEKRWSELPLGHDERVAQTPVEVTPEITKPKMIMGCIPLYPHQACRDKIEGKVTVRVVVDTEGFVTAARVTDNPLAKGTVLHEKFGEYAEACADSWRFEPATQNGRPITVYHTIKMAFNPEFACKPDNPIARSRANR
ncbi:MAG: energy transducer TonB [Acidobacteria bacterium]|nr:energy transducer TonB [Acidobacteriota bacterium]MCY3968385.1 energy transducer TonB [Acidobacteriota bacterium]